jgi:hypothetical protein
VICGRAAPNHCASSRGSGCSQRGLGVSVPDSLSLRSRVQQLGCEGNGISSPGHVLSRRQAQARALLSGVPFSKCSPVRYPTKLLRSRRTGVLVRRFPKRRPTLFTCVIMSVARGILSPVIARDEECVGLIIARLSDVLSVTLAVARRSVSQMLAVQPQSFDRS